MGAAFHLALAGAVAFTVYGVYLQAAPVLARVTEALALIGGL